MTRMTTVLWFDHNAEEAANFYASLIPDSKVTAVVRSPLDYPNGKAGDVITVEFTLLGQSFSGLNGGPLFKFSEAFSLMLRCADQAEVDHYWNALTADGGSESQCGWCKDRFGLSWQVTPQRMLDIFAAGGEPAKRAMEAMFHMRKFDIAAIEAAAKG